MKNQVYIESLKNQQETPFYIAELDDASKDWRSLEKEGINSTLYAAYHASRKAGQKLINFDDLIWEKDVAAIVSVLKENHIGEFTISCKFCDLIDRLADLEKLQGRLK